MEEERGDGWGAVLVLRSFCTSEDAAAVLCERLPRLLCSEESGVRISLALLLRPGSLSASRVVFTDPQHIRISTGDLRPMHSLRAFLKLYAFSSLGP